MSHSFLLSLLLPICVLSFCSEARGGVILYFDGSQFTDTFGEPTFSTSDRVTGTITFDDFGPLVAPIFDVPARSFTLSTTVNGLPGFTFDVPDASIDGVTLNTFDFAPGSLIPTGFALTVSGNVFGDPNFDEEISISSIGDLVTIDGFGPTEAIAFNIDPGNFTAVPEPSSLTLFCVAAFAATLRRPRCK
jgi:hypothetical protein